MLLEVSLVISSFVTAASAEILEELYAGRKVQSQIGTSPSGKVVTLIDGKVQPIYFAALTGPSPEYKRAGFNTIHYELFFNRSVVPLWRQLEQHFESWDRGLLEVKRAGLYVMIYIHNSIHSAAGKAPWTFDEQWKKVVHSIVKRYKDVTNLIAWTYSDEHGDSITYPVEGFREFLRQEYGAIGVLNETWGSKYHDFDEIVLEYQRDGHGRPMPSMVSPEAPFKIGPKAFDSASYKAFRVGQCCQKFEQAIREVDPGIPIISPGNNLGWASTQVPTTWGITFDFYPGYSGSDMDTHHVWMVDIGRGPNVRPAMQFLLPERWEAPKWHLDARVLRGWMVESAIHGATGVTFWPWSMLGHDNLMGDRSSSTQRINTVGMTIRTLEASGIFEMLPKPTIGVIYQPYAEGWGAMSQVYGTMRYPSDEPIVLFRQLKFGTKYGQVDYLTPLHMDAANLDDYGVILAPFAVNIPPAHMTQLTEYVHNGGVLFADVGFGCIQAGKTVTAMTNAAKSLFGINNLSKSKAEPGAFVATGEFTELLGRINEGDSIPSSSEVGMCIKGSNNTHLTRRGLTRLALDVEPSTAVAALRGPGRQGLYVNKVGEGYAIFCSTLAWTSTTVKDPLMRQIHNALFSRRSQIEQLEEEDYSNVEKQPYFTQGYEIALFANGYVMQNLLDEHTTMRLRVLDAKVTHTLAPRSVLLVRDEQIIPLGSGVWPVELGPVAN